MGNDFHYSDADESCYNFDRPGETAQVFFSFWMKIPSFLSIWMDLRGILFCCLVDASRFLTELAVKDCNRKTSGGRLMCAGRYRWRPSAADSRSTAFCCCVSRTLEEESDWLILIGPFVRVDSVRRTHTHTQGPSDRSCRHLSALLDPTGMKSFQPAQHGWLGPIQPDRTPVDNWNDWNSLGNWQRMFPESCWNQFD